MFTILPPSQLSRKCLKTAKIGHFETQNAMGTPGVWIVHNKGEWACQQLR
nr:MAG TPA: hypothetical protein [Caudoviricetes sp.]